jgi:hypothetical protein
VVLELGLPRHFTDLGDITREFYRWVVPDLVDVDLELWR